MPETQVTLGSHFEIKEKIQQLQNSLLASHPLIPTLLRTIHQQLKADPEIVTILSEAEVQIVVSGLEKMAGIKLAETITAPKKKSLKNLTIDDL